MKKFLALILAALMLVSFAACGGSEESTDNSDAVSANESQGTTETTEFKVGAIYINSKNDTAGYTYAHHNGITTAMQQLGLNTDTQLFIVDEVPEDPEQVRAAVDTLANQGVNIIFGISFGYIDALEAKWCYERRPRTPQKYGGL